MQFHSLYETNDTEIALTPPPTPPPPPPPPTTTTTTATTILMNFKQGKEVFWKVLQVFVRPYILKKKQNMWRNINIYSINVTEVCRTVVQSLRMRQIVVTFACVQTQHTQTQI